MSFLPVIGSTRASTVDEAEVVAAPQQSADVTPSPPSSGRATRRPQNYSITDSQSSTEAQAARIAKRIWGGSIEHDGYMKMIGRVRQQFLSPQMDHPPMVLNPTVPSSMRPEEAGVPKFSRGLKLYRHLCTNLQQRQQADQTSPASEEAPIPPAVEEPEVELADLPTLEEKTLRLLQLESLSREHIAATEKWDRQVVSEMMIVRYVTCVLKPEVEKHLAMERHVRGELQAEEADERYDLTHQSEVAQLIHNGLESAQAELIKASRLQRNDRRYPRTSLPSIAASTASSKAALVPSTSPPPTEDARSILQRYVREKHGSGTAWGAPPPPRDDGLPPIHRSPTPRILSLSTYMQLMEDYQTERAMVVTLEEECRRACLRLVDEDRQRLARWVDKNRHLERLVQWRAAREQRLKEEMDDLTNPSRMEYRLEEGTARQLTQEEEPARLALHEEEGEAHDQLCTHAGHLQEEHQTQILELRCRQACDATFAETQAQLIGLAVQQEEDGRKLVEDARQKWSNITGQRAHELIQQLAKVSTSSTKSAAVAVLQRAFRQSILGKLGWRYSHWLVGREVQARRNARTIERGQAEMASWKAQIASESQHITNQILSEQRAAQQLIVSAEEKKREEMLTDEARGWLDLRRLWNQDLRVQVFLPLSSKCVADEHVQRTEADVMEGIERRRLISWFRRMMSIISSKLLTTQNEQSYRDDIEQEEYYAHKELVGEELDRREELRLDAEEAARQLVRDQAQWVWSAVEEVEAFADELLRGHLQVILRLQMRLLDRSLAHTDVFARVAAAEREERADLLSSWALEDSALLAVVSLHSHALSLANEGMELTQQYEELRRAKAVEDEDEQWKGIEERMRGKSGPRLLTRTDQCRAVDAISRFYKRHREGDVGRSATIRYLHEYFRPKREQAELNRLRNNNAAHVQFVREQLEDQIEKQRDEARDACQDALDYLVEKMEPRAREDIEGMEDLIANILYRNVQMHCTAVAFDPSDAVALLWQKESYERVLVMQEWRAEFKDVFLPKKATFVQDVSVRPIQRAWRAYRLRKAWKERCAAEVRQLEEEEMQGRHEVEREELLEAGLEVVPCVAEGMELELWMTCYPPLLATLNESCLNTLAVEEWNARADILWEMRREEMSTSELMEVELMERAALVMEMHTNDAHAELFEDEAMERGMLCRERVLFLLRILVKEERVRRDGALRDSYELATREIMDHYEALRRNAIADAYCQFWQKEIYLPLHRLFITVDLDRLYTHDVQQLYTINQEGIERAHIKCSCKEQWLWICRGQETSDRNLVEIQEKLEREHINFFLEEAKARMKVEEDWFDPMRYMPSDFAAGLVNVVRQVYVRYLEETEDRVREHIESTEIPERRELAYRYVVENPIYIAKCIRQQKELAAEEQAARQTIRDACVQAVEYFPSSFAPEVVLHPEGIYVQCIAETEGHSRGYLVDAEHRERTDIEERFASTSPALWVFHREQRAEFVAREECEREELIDECHRGIRYFPSTFAPELINQGVSVYIKYLQDTEELVREYVDSREVAHRGQIEYDFAEELPTLENYLHKQRRDLGLNETAEREAIIDAWSPFMTIAAANAAAAAQAQREEEARETELAQNEAEARAREEMLADHQAKAASSSSEDAEPAPPTPPYTSELAFCMKNSNALADFFYATETRQRRALEEKQRLIHKGIVDLFKYKVPWLRLEQRDRMQEQSEKYFLGGWGGQLPHH